MNIREPSCIVLELETMINRNKDRVTNGMQSLDVCNSVEFMRLGWFAAVHLLNSFETILLHIGPVCEVTDYPSEGITEVDSSSNC